MYFRHTGLEDGKQKNPSSPLGLVVVYVDVFFDFESSGTYEARSDHRP